MCGLVQLESNGYQKDVCLIKIGTCAHCSKYECHPISKFTYERNWEDLVYDHLISMRIFTFTSIFEYLNLDLPNYHFLVIACYIFYEKWASWTFQDPSTLVQPHYFIIDPPILATTRWLRNLGRCHMTLGEHYIIAIKNITIINMAHQFNITMKQIMSNVLIIIYVW